MSRIWIKWVVLGCYRDNITSNKTIINNGVVLYCETTMDGKDAVYYKIKIRFFNTNYYIIK